jgi:hypothetical protein
MNIDDFGRETVTRAEDLQRRSAPLPSQMRLRVR